MLKVRLICTQHHYGARCSGDSFPCLTFGPEQLWHCLSGANLVPCSFGRAMDGYAVLAFRCVTTILPTLLKSSRGVCVTKNGTERRLRPSLCTLVEYGLSCEECI